MWAYLAETVAKSAGNDIDGIIDIFLWNAFATILNDNKWSHCFLYTFNSGFHNTPLLQTIHDSEQTLIAVNIVIPYMASGDVVE